MNSRFGKSVNVLLVVVVIVYVLNNIYAGKVLWDYGALLLIGIGCAVELATKKIYWWLGLTTTIWIGAGIIVNHPHTIGVLSAAAFVVAMCFLIFSRLRVIERPCV